MDIGSDTFHEFKVPAFSFRRFPAQGLLTGGCMVEMVEPALPQGILYEAVVQNLKCLPDVLQLLIPCSAGNNWMKFYTGKLNIYAPEKFVKRQERSLARRRY